MLVLQPDPWECGEVGLRNFCLWFQNPQSLMCGEMLQLLMFRVIIAFYNCLISRKYLPSQPSGFSARCFLVFPAFYYKKDLSKSSVIYHSTRTWKSSFSFFPPIYFIWYHWLSSTTFPSTIFKAVFFSCITFPWSKITEKNKHSSSSYQQVSQQWQEEISNFFQFLVIKYTNEMQKQLDKLYSLTFLEDLSLRKQDPWSIHVFAT